MSAPLTPEQQQLVLDYRRWAEQYVEQRFRPYASGREDLYQQAMIGLIQAAAKYDESRGVHFSVYARDWVYSHVSQYMRRDRTIVQPYKEMRQGEAYPYAFTPTDTIEADEGLHQDVLTSVEPGYEAIDDESERVWVAEIINRYGPEVYDYFVEHGADDTELGQRGKLMAQEIREGFRV